MPSRFLPSFLFFTYRAVTRKADLSYLEELYVLRANKQCRNGDEIGSFTYVPAIYLRRGKERLTLTNTEQSTFNREIFRRKECDGRDLFDQDITADERGHSLGMGRPINGRS